MRHRGPAAALLVLAPLLLAACAEKKPDLKRVYRPFARPSRPVVLIPGAFGSRLRDAPSGRIVWGRAASFFARLYRPWDAEWDLLDLPIDAEDPLRNRDGLEPAGVFDKVAGREFYARVLRTLSEAGGYTPGDIRSPRPGEDLFAFDYDWRRDAAETAARLAAAIDGILAARGEPDGKVDLVGHSFGGLLARYYLLYGAGDVLDRPEAVPTFEGARHVRALVHLGTPNAGTMEALRSLVDGAQFVRLLPADAVFTMPAAWQLLPHPGEPILLDGSGDPIAADVLDPAAWERFGWSAFDPERIASRRSDLRRRLGPEAGRARFEEEAARERRFASWALGRARRFIASLRPEVERRSGVTFVAFGGDCRMTPARAVVLFDGVRHRTYFDPEDLPHGVRSQRLEDLMLEPGDGSVTRGSLLGRLAGGKDAGEPLPIDAATFVCESHRLLTENVTFQDNLLHVLLERDR